MSFLTDLSSEAIFAVLPVFMTSVLGASALLLGTMEGLADFAASSLDLASGYASDRLGKRKGLAVLGYGLSTAAKTVLVFAATAGQVFAFRVVERLGKSIRGAPRDALLAGVAPREKRGTSFGLHKALDKAGAVAGPLVAFALLDRFGQSLDSFRRLFLVAVVPAFASVLVLVLLVPERKAEGSKRVPLREAVRTLGPGYRHYLISAGIFSASYFSYAFLLLAAARAHFETKHVALLYALFNVSFTVLSVPIGRLGDRIGRRAIIALSYVLYALMAVGFAVATSKTAVIGLFLVYGLFYAIDEGQTKAFISDLVPDASRATAIGAYGFVTALVYLPASLVAGGLWKAFGPAATFGVAAAIAVVALVYFLAFQPRQARAES
ncbi:MAG TPA: MFS transporter [Polyangiaceae bacterium]|nr:MFS transporter [Polyangiaceae bacterium]